MVWPLGGSRQKEDDDEHEEGSSRPRKTLMKRMKQEWKDGYVRRGPQTREAEEDGDGDAQAK